MPDEEIPAHSMPATRCPVLAEALIFIAAVTVDLGTLVGMMARQSLGACSGPASCHGCRDDGAVGNGRRVTAAASLFLATNLNLMPEGAAVGLAGGRLVFAVAANFLLGA